MSRTYGFRIPSWMPYLVGPVSVVVIVSFWWHLRTLESTRIDLETQAEARSISAKIHDDLNHRAHSLERMQSRWEQAGGTPRKQWEADADLYILHHPGWRAVSWVDTDYIVRWIRPLEENRQAVGLNLSFEEGRRKTLLEVRHTNEPLMTPAIDLVQGGVGSLMLHPLTVGESFGGFLSTVFDLGAWLQYIVQSESRPFSVRVFMNNREVYQSPDNRNEWALRHMQSNQWQAQGNQWRVEVHPLPGLLAERKSVLEPLSLLLGLLFSCFLTITFYLAASATQRAERLRKLAGDLQRSNDELSKFAYVASHDLREPLRGIEHLGRWIEEDAGDRLPEESKKNMTLLRGRVRRMDQLLQDLLQYSRAGRTPTAISEVCTEDLVKDAWAMQNPPPGARLIVHPGMPTLKTIAVPLEQVFSNLLGNALKHAGHDQLVVEVRAENQADATVFTIQDNGPGIPVRYRTKVFEMFKTLRPRDEMEGSGMGLAIVRKTLDIVGGDITLDDAAERGCVFRVTWPKTIDNELTEHG